MMDARSVEIMHLDNEIYRGGVGLNRHSDKRRGMVHGSNRLLEGPQEHRSSSIRRTRRREGKTTVLLPGVPASDLREAMQAALGPTQLRESIEERAPLSRPGTGVGSAAVAGGGNSVYLQDASLMDREERAARAAWEAALHRAASRVKGAGAESWLETVAERAMQP